MKNNKIKVLALLMPIMLLLIAGFAEATIGITFPGNANNEVTINNGENAVFRVDVLTSPSDKVSYVVADLKTSAGSIVANDFFLRTDLNLDTYIIPQFTVKPSNYHIPGTYKVEIKALSTQGYSYTKTMTLIVRGSNHAPVSMDKTYSFLPGTTNSIMFPATDSDGDYLTYKLTDDPDQGKVIGDLEGNMLASRYNTYQAYSTACGTDSFRYKAYDGQLYSNEGTITINFPACTAPQPPAATCSDGIQNQGETGIDCGGPCAACAPAPNQPPVWTGNLWNLPISGFIYTNFASIYYADVSGLRMIVNDPDGDNNKITFKIVGESGVNCEFVGNSLMIYSTQNFIGTGTCSLKAVDEKGAESTAKSFNVVVSSSPSGGSGGGSGGGSTPQPPADTNPTVNIIANPTTGNAPLTVAFSAQITSGNSPFTYAWDFNNDGTTDSTAAAPSYTYTTAGTYTARLTIRDNDGDTASDTQNIIVTSTQPTPLTVTLAALPMTGTAPLFVTFNAGVTGGSGTYTTYAWSFGDGATSPSTSNQQTHTYTTAGAYTATLTVTDSAGNTGSDSVIITVTQPPATQLNVDITAAPTTGNAPLYVIFTSTVTGGTPSYTYAWDFTTDGTSDSAQQIGRAHV